MTPPDGAGKGAWTGDWVSQRLGVDVYTTDAHVGVALIELVGLAVRRNPRRAHLLVSKILGKHVPADPRLIYGSGLLLGRMTELALMSPAGAVASNLVGGNLLRLALEGSPGAARALVDYARRPLDASPAKVGTVVLGYAETATALGHSVADALGAPTLHSTRRPVPGLLPVGSFEEEHSHATSHLLLPDDPALLAGDGPVVLVDDELSTGTTALNTISALHTTHPRTHFLIAALVDLRSELDKARMRSFAETLGVRIDVVALAAGRVRLPEDVLVAGRELVERSEAAQVPPNVKSGPPQTDPACRAGVVAVPRPHRIEVPAPHGLREGGRHGFTPADRAVLEQYLAVVATEVGAVTGARRSVHILGFEELMYAPLRLAHVLADNNESQQITYSTTTRSPVLTVPDVGYAIGSRLIFPAHDNPADGPGSRYAYNVIASAVLQQAADTVVLVIDDVAEAPELTAPNGLLPQLLSVAAQVVLVVLPTHRPRPSVSAENLHPREATQ